MGDTKIKYIKDLKDYKFYIPAYQRGYRWTGQEVKDLLDDIYEFDTGTKDNPKSYCLQPLIVKKREDGTFEVVDGQQRLTTILIFLKISQFKTGYESYKIEFETRKESEKFLSNLTRHDGEIIDDNIDYYHITSAYKKIKDWLISMTETGIPEFTVLSDLFNKVTNSVFFIWHEISDNVKAADIFTRVNMGKIPLSNAELVKAILFNKDNFGSDYEKSQQELSLEWDRIERDLHRDSFWYFLMEENGEKYETRIDLIFDLLSNEYNERLPEDLKVQVSNASIYRNRTFLIYYTVYKNHKDKNSFVKELWQKVELIHERFLEWYYDLNLYHIVGYLLSAGTRIDRVFEISRNKRKSEILSSLIEETRRHVSVNSKEKLEEITYDENRKKLRNLFLLINIATLVCKSEKQYRFPFDLYKKEKWDIEHIHANADISAESDDSLGNLTLLSAEINRSYKDAIFKDKRSFLINDDMKGKFIPICTKNVFIKYYSSQVKDMNTWDDDDKEAYIKAMWEVVDKFRKEEFGK